MMKNAIPTLKPQVRHSGAALFTLTGWLLLGTWIWELGILDLPAQQTPQYTQFMLNNYGINPAACGISNNKMDVLAGLRRQWVGFENMPITSFFNFNSYFGRQGGGINQGWHGLGAYYQADRMGIRIKTDDFYVSYTYLMRMARKGFIAFGMAGGGRRYGLRINDLNDPVLRAKNVWLYPDFIPGVKFFNNKWTFDLSVKQLYKFRVKQGSNKIGSPAKLPPHLYCAAAYKWWARSYLLVVHSFQMKYTFSSLPSLDYNVIAYLNKNLAVGVNYRHLDSFAAIVQFRFDKLVIGIAYDYSIAPYRIGFANTQEMMLGISPSPYGNTDSQQHYRTAECPTFQY